MERYYSNGKVLLTGEYVVLDGAKALALPTIFGQNLLISTLKTSKKQLHWKSLDKDNNCWFECTFNLPDFTYDTNKITSLKEEEIAKTLQKILLEIKGLNSLFLSEKLGVQATSKVTFPLNWGLGTSSTLINNMAQWGKVDPYKLQFKIFGGSAYDIACAQNDSPILYQLLDKKPKITVTNFNPKFTKNLYFVHLNTKKNSREAIKSYLKNKKHTKEIQSKINRLTEKLTTKNLTLTQFEGIITQHEKILSSVLNIKPVKETLFPDYFGSIKSLGAWGGDFILATGNNSTKDYFKAKGYETVIPYEKMVKAPHKDSKIHP